MTCRTMVGAANMPNNNDILDQLLGESKAKPDNKHNTDYLIFDMTNVLYRTFFANKSEDDRTIAGLAHHAALMTLNKYFKKYKPNKKVIMCFDRPSWRKEYTKSDQCVSKKKYKGNRRQQMTDAERNKFQAFMDHIGEFEEIMKTQTTTVCLSQDGLEADDFVALFTHAYPNDKTTIISGDKDLIQLITDNVELVDPQSGKNRTLNEWNGDAELFLFEKCFRGDLGDNVQSAYPRLRKTKILAAFDDDFVFNNLLQDTWTDQEDTEFLVKELFDENRRLMDLRCQPDDIQRSGLEHILSEMKHPGNFSYFHFLRFCGNHELKRVSAQIETFIPMLSL